MEMIIGSDGNIRMIYSDNLAGLLDEGPATVKRASHVEPAPGGGWTADMSPCKGPVLGPYHTRTEALQAETGWLIARNIPVPA